MATETRKTGRLRGSEAKSRDFEKWGSVCLCVCVCWCIGGITLTRPATWSCVSALAGEGGGLKL